MDRPIESSRSPSTASLALEVSGFPANASARYWHKDAICDAVEAARATLVESDGVISVSPIRAEVRTVHLPSKGQRIIRTKHRDCILSLPQLLLPIGQPDLCRERAKLLVAI